MICLPLNVNPPHAKSFSHIILAFSVNIHPLCKGYSNFPGYKSNTRYFLYSIGDSNEAKIRVAEYSTILFQQGRFLSRVRPTKFKANMITIKCSQVSDGQSDQTCM